VTASLKAMLHQVLSACSSRLASALATSWDSSEGRGTSASLPEVALTCAQQAAGSRAG
jgi:hypothetical protein